MWAESADTYFCARSEAVYQDVLGAVYTGEQLRQGLTMVCDTPITTLGCGI